MFGTVVYAGDKPSSQDPIKYAQAALRDLQSHLHLTDHDLAAPSRGDSFMQVTMGVAHGGGRKVFTPLT